MRGSTTVAARRRLAVLALPIVSLAGSLACRPTDPGPPPTSFGRTPPPVVVSGGRRTLELRPFSWCWAQLCGDGIPPADPPSIGSPPQVTLQFPVPGWTFSASFVPMGQAGPGVPGRIIGTGTTRVVVPPEAPGDYRVNVFGSGQDPTAPDGRGRGDLATVFRWTVTGDR